MAAVVEDSGGDGNGGGDIMERATVRSSKAIR